MGTFLKKEVRLESKQLLNHGNSCLHTDAIDISKSYNINEPQARIYCYSNKYPNYV